MAVPLSPDVKDQIPRGDHSASLSADQARRIMRRQLELLPGRAFLSPSDIDALCRRLPGQRYAAGEAIVMEGAHGDCLGLVVGGQVAGYSSLVGRGRPDVLLLAGSTFGEAMLLDGAPSNRTYRALTGAEVRFLRRSDLMVVIDGRRYRLAALINRWLRRLAALVPVLIALTLLLATPFVRDAVALTPYAAGLWFARQGRMAGAEKALALSVRLAPEWPMPHLSLGNVYLYRGALEQAEAELRRVLSLAPDVAEAHNSLGLLYMLRGEQGTASTCFQDALAVQPGQATIEGNLAYSLQLAGQPDAALPHYALARVLGRPRPALWVNEAIAHYTLGDRDQARATAIRALDLDGGSAAAYTVLGAAALPEQPEEAIRLLNAATGAEPGYAPAHFYLGLAAKLLGRTDEASAAFERVLALEPADPLAEREARGHLSELYAQDASPVRAP